MLFTEYFPGAPLSSRAISATAAGDFDVLAVLDAAIPAAEALADIHRHGLMASQAVSGELILDRLIETLLTIVVEHAGAERGLLIRPRGVKHDIEDVSAEGAYPA